MLHMHPLITAIFPKGFALGEVFLFKIMSTLNIDIFLVVIQI